jgi:hypothetical protein
VALMFDAERHEYFLDGFQLPSVTGILRESGLFQLDLNPTQPWALEILNKARARGTAVHKLVHYYNERDLDWASVDPHWRPYLEAWVRYTEERRVRPLLCEFRLASRRLKCCGTGDLLCEIDGDGWLLDFKTGDPEDVAADLQTAGYLLMAHEWRAEDPKLAAVLDQFPIWRRASVRLMQTGKYHTTEYRDTRELRHFQLAAAMWHVRQARGVPIVPYDAIAA